MSGLRRVAIAGLGLIGGSLARALAATGVEVAGYDADAATLRAALGAGAVHVALDASFTGTRDADAFVLAVPVHALAATLAHAAPQLGGVRLVTDVGSTKRSIVRAARGLGLGDRFVGGHPFAGSHEAGWPAARASLFEGARVYLCPPAADAAGAAGVAGTDGVGEAQALAVALWQRVGALPVTIDAAAHDHLLAWTSHLPHAVATALAGTLGGAGVRHPDLGAAGRDMTRLAASDATLWTGIALDNASELAPALAALEHALAGCRAALEAADEPALRRYFESGRNALHG